MATRTIVFNNNHIGITGHFAEMISGCMTLLAMLIVQPGQTPFAGMCIVTGRTIQIAHPETFTFSEQLGLVSMYIHLIPTLNGNHIILQAVSHFKSKTGF